MVYNKFANRILALSFAIFLAATFLKYYLGNLFIVNLIFFVMQAALVGGIADWFAVTALFRKPLGFPWHTAIIPSNREKLIDSLAGMIEEELLSTASIKNRLNRLHLVNMFIDWAEKQGSPYFIEIAAKFIQKIFDKIDIAKTAQYIESMIKENADRLDIGPLLKRLGTWLTEKGEDEKWLNLILDEMILIAEKPGTRDRIREIMEEIKDRRTQSLLSRALGKIAEITNTINLDDAAEALQFELLEVLRDLKNEGHPLRLRLKTIFSELPSKFDRNPSWSKTLNIWKKTIIERVDLGSILEVLINSAIKKVNQPLYGTEDGLAGNKQKPIDSEISSFVNWLIGQVNIFWQRLKQDSKNKDRLNKYFKKIIFQIIESEHKLIGNIVRETLSSLTNEDLNRFVEDKAGNDLQWIRVNGSLVGALVGLLIFLFLNLFYDPVVVPVIKSWLM
ncbi:protein of unknown function DUF445 [Desulfofarcimen acetoxidans DSM 771]|uniref:DUF445 domain-containing protein n=1 Tax=Desulfofarcimen acetoxidans (strain ATCC 49208 / DSM 771 / KCTC 5769 / VKM B-1644 / 5575) TaxID=485916 RepID=C8VYF2_DESAS|nr:DUF445 domain-containing protein [Desulfofarcimen acetoxidans]ACV62833.1 protein of unknown function DUF445 [Desulfofarcimen acetoxidans DSM 771]